MANDSSLLPTTPTAPAAAVLTTSSAGTGATANNAIAYDYSPHLIRIVTALEQVSLSMAFIADKIDNVPDKLTDLATQSSIQNSILSSMYAAITPGSTTIGAILSDIAQASEDTARATESMTAAVTPGSTTIGAILSDIAQASENSAVSLAGIYDRSKGAGIHMKGPLDWVGLVSTYKLYVENVGPENITLAGLIAFKAKIDALPKEF
jgi:hypothetical protein